MTRPVRRASALVGALLAVRCGSPTGPTPPKPTSPVIACPAPLTVGSLDGQPTLVTFGSATATNGTQPLTITCTPANNTVFPIGQTTVTCTVVDHDQRRDSCSFIVTVTAPPTISMTAFIAFGDSMTYGENGIDSLASFDTRFHPQYQVSNPYPVLLRHELSARYTKQTFIVANDGLGGERAQCALQDPSNPECPSGPGTIDTLSRFHRDVIGHYQVVLLLEGANDLYDKDASEVPLAIGGLRAMLNDAKTYGVVPYIGTLPPENPAGLRGRGYFLVDQFNSQVAALAQSIPGVTLVDLNKAFNGDLSLLSADGLHPNEQGYQLMADTFFSVLKDTLEQPPGAATPSLLSGILRAPAAPVASPEGAEGAGAPRYIPRARQRRQ
jgi:GDSL-like Lipase/Acylhydrolase family/HYR domain